MPFSYDEQTNAITMAAGDTATIGVSVEWEKLTVGDVVLFAVFDPNQLEDLLCKVAEIEEGNAVIRLCNHDTRDIEPGRYKWNLRIVTSPAIDENGNVVADECTDDVITAFDTPPMFRITRGGARV